MQQDFDGPRTIAFINPKGGAAKTTGVLATGYTFGTVRGGGVIAWDNNETRGTLGIRGARSNHRNTTRELLEDLDRFCDVYQSRIGDLGAFVRSQGDAHFDVLASDERPDVTGMIRGQDFNDVHRLLERFYRVDPGRHRQQHARRELARRGRRRRPSRGDEHGPRGHRLQRALDARRPRRTRAIRTSSTRPSPCSPTRPPTSTSELARDLVDVYHNAPADVYRVPLDPALVTGSVVPYGRLSEDTRRAWLHACAGMAAAL